LPRDNIADAQTLIAFFLPLLTATIVRERMSAKERAVTFIETNEPIARLSVSKPNGVHTGARNEINDCTSKED